MAEPKVVLPQQDRRPVSRISGKVAQIVNERELIINRGAQDGVAVGMKFAVLADRDLEVKDPDTGNVIVLYPREKTRVQIVQVFDAAAVGRTFQTLTIGGRYYNYNLISLAGLIDEDDFASPKTIVEKMSVEDASLPSPLARTERIVRPGDRVALVGEDESAS